MRFFPWVRETTTSDITTAIGQQITLSSSTGFARFSAIPNIKTNEHFVVEINQGNDREVGLWKYVGSNTLERVAVWHKLVSGTFTAGGTTGLDLTGASATVTLTNAAVVQGAPSYYTGAVQPMALRHSYRSLSTLAVTANRVYAIPIKIDAPIALTDALLEVTTNAGGSTASIGIYTCGADGGPGVRLGQAAAFATTANQIYAPALDETVYCSPGEYWGLLICSHAITVRAFAAGVPIVGRLGNNTTAAGTGLVTNSNLYVYKAGSGTTLDAEYTGSWTSQTSGAEPIVAFGP